MAHQMPRRFCGYRRAPHDDNNNNTAPTPKSDNTEESLRPRCHIVPPGPVASLPNSPWSNQLVLFAPRRGAIVDAE
ncbi:hypothetical protein TYRP_023302 [Tyrophagus putrescentiae]|nr:hypothetical protein TYRP_023302 [Tyrophagus putrescentiae]